MKMKTAPATGVVDCGFACHTRVAAKACGHEFDPPGGAQRRAWPGNFRWTLQDALDATLDRPRSNADLLILFALAAMTLAAVGLYGLVTREMGVTIALQPAFRALIFGVSPLDGLSLAYAAALLAAVSALAALVPARRASNGSKPRASITRHNGPGYKVRQETHAGAEHQRHPYNANHQHVHAEIAREARTDSSDLLILLVERQPRSGIRVGGGIRELGGISALRTIQGFFVKLRSASRTEHLSTSLTYRYEERRRLVPSAMRQVADVDILEAHVGLAPGV
jgi:hypothetical protein